MDNQEILTNLFNSIPIVSEEHLEVLLQTMSTEDANYVIIQALKYAYDKGVFSIGETEVLSKALRILSKNNSND